MTIDIRELDEADLDAVALLEEATNPSAVDPSHVRGGTIASPGEPALAPR